MSLEIDFKENCATATTLVHPFTHGQRERDLLACQAQYEPSAAR